MADWIYFLHAPRENFAATMTDDEKRVWGEHFVWLKQWFEGGNLLMVGPTLGPINTGVAIFEAPDQATAQKIVDQDPCIRSGYAKGELRGFKISMLRGRL